MIATLTSEDRQVPEIKHALQVRCAVSLGDYQQLFELATTAPNMGGYLMDHFLPREQTLALQAMCKAYDTDTSVFLQARSMTDVGIGKYPCTFFLSR